MEWSAILQLPEVRQIVQENFLTREFEDALFPRLLFRADIEAIPWPMNAGDTQIFTGAGLIKGKQRPLKPNQDPTPSSYTFEQWFAQAKPYGDSIDTDMPTSSLSISSLLLRDMKNLGISAADTTDSIIRNRMYRAALSGNTVVDGAQTSTTNLRVLRISGFTLARNSTSAPVRFDTVTTANPLQIALVDSTGAAQVRNVIGFVADLAAEGDVDGPGTLTLNSAITVLDRSPVKAVDSSFISRVGGGTTIDALNSSNTFSLLAVRNVLQRLEGNSVPGHADGYFHCHFDQVSKAQVFGDSEFQRLRQGVPDDASYRKYAVTEVLNTIYYMNVKCPQASSWDGNTDNTFAGQDYTVDDPFTGEVFNASNVPIHRPIFTGMETVKEYWIDGKAALAPSGLRGETSTGARFTQNGISIDAERIEIIIRGPVDRRQKVVSSTWSLIADWPTRTDATSRSKSPERFKRMVACEHAE